VLLRDNIEYGQFLRKYYQGAEFQIEKIIQVKDGAIADVTVVFSSKDSQRYSFFLVKNHADKNGEGNWKVVRQSVLEKFNERPRF
jgi:hypothetical protein